MSEEYKRGLKDGHKWALEHFDTITGKMNFPKSFGTGENSNQYDCGFAEGGISGRSEKIEKEFGSIKSISFGNGKRIIER